MTHCFGDHRGLDRRQQAALQPHAGYHGTHPCTPAGCSGTLDIPFTMVGERRLSFSLQCVIRLVSCPTCSQDLSCFGHSAFLACIACRLQVSYFYSSTVCLRLLISCQRETIGLSLCLGAVERAKRLQGPCLPRVPRLRADMESLDL